MALACYLWLFHYCEKKAFSSKIRLLHTREMFGVSFKQWKSPAHKQVQGSHGQPSGCIALGIRWEYAGKRLGWLFRANPFWTEFLQY